MSSSFSKNQIDSVLSEYQSIRRDFAKAVSDRQQLEAQLKENEIVQNEFNLLKKENDVYKLVGPTLLKQDKQEAFANVAKRMDFIRAEIRKSEDILKALQAKQEAKEEDLVRIQQAQEGLSGKSE